MTFRTVFAFYYPNDTGSYTLDPSCRCPCPKIEYNKILRKKISLCTAHFFFRADEVEIRQTFATIVALLRCATGLSRRSVLP